MASVGIERSTCLFCGEVVVLNPFVGVWQLALSDSRLDCPASNEDYDWCHVPVPDYDAEDRSVAAEGLLAVLRGLAA